MNKKDWEVQLKEMERLHTIAEDNIKKAQAQADELEFNISNYKAKIATFK